MSDFEFRLWVGLITQVDDAGRGDARPAIIKGHVFPLRERVSIKDIDAAIHSLAAKGCVSLYEVGGRPYFWFPTWSEHQRIRDCKPKYPGPDESVSVFQSAADCGELPQVAAGCGLNPIQSNPNPNPNPNISAEPDADSAQIAAELPLNDGTFFEISMKQCQEWSGLYPAVDVMQQLRAMRGWLGANPSKRKTKAGIKRFVNGWLAREQDRGGSVKRDATGKGNSNVFMDMLREEESHGT
ncbi:MAG: hypothetical protein SO072_13595 [Dysosmobacter sp.]|nr:hypothetical protein [Dysosmobacter sp.]